MTYTTRLVRHYKYSWENRKDEYVCVYCWSDVEKCHLTKTKDDDGHLLLTGTAENFLDFLRYANDHLKYVDYCYKYDNEELNKAIELLRKNGFQGNYQWWYIGTVD